MPPFDPTDPRTSSTAPSRALQIKSLPFPGKKAKEKVKEAAGEYITDPLAEAGYPDTGAALGAAAATAADVIIPESWEDAALSAVPVGKGAKIMGKAGEEFVSLLRKLDKEIEGAKTVGERSALLVEKKALKDMAAENSPALDYKELKDQRAAERAAAEAAAPTIDYSKIPANMVEKEKKRSR